MTWILVVLIAMIPSGIKQYTIETPYPTREACEAAGAELILDVESPALLFNCVQRPDEEA